MVLVYIGEDLLSNFRVGHKDLKLVCHVDSDQGRQFLLCDEGAEKSFTVDMVG